MIELPDFSPLRATATSLAPTRCRFTSLSILGLSVQIADAELAGAASGARQKVRKAYWMSRIVLSMNAVARVRRFKSRRFMVSPW